jgi:long-chain acyl-CoA synthetase
VLPFHYAEDPEKLAYVMATSGERVTFRQLEDRSNQGAQLFRRLGLHRGDGLAILMENNARYFEVVWAAHRAGLAYTCISTKLMAREVAYILKDCRAKLLVTSQSLSSLAREAAADLPDLLLYCVGEAPAPFRSFEAERAAEPPERIADEALGDMMLYSSGTTGQPKGVKRAPVTDRGVDDNPALSQLGQLLYGLDDQTVFLSPAPLYHAAPIGWTMAATHLGGCIVVMEHFDAEAALAAIERHRVTCAQWVPTHFIRLLKLPEEVRARYDLSSLKSVFHAAAPCPVPVKEAMIAWWGPIVNEYYAGTEGNGFCAISAPEWLAHKGSVGRGLTAQVMICDEAGDPLPPRQEGEVFFAGGGVFEYFNDPEKTAKSRNKHGWSTLGDVGWVDEDGYLYLTDRKSFMIISGGVNIYPQEVENLLITHPKVADVAVVGAPHEEMGEEVVAVVQPVDWAEAGEALAAELMAFARANISHVKAPRRIDFMQELPRHATGKLYKRLIRDAYWADKRPAAS